LADRLMALAKAAQQAGANNVWLVRDAGDARLAFGFDDGLDIGSGGVVFIARFKGSDGGEAEVTLQVGGVRAEG